MRPRALLTVVLVWGLWCAAGVTPPGWPAPAEEGPPNRGDHPPLGYRRVYVPQERIKDWPHGNVRYVPMDQVEFDRLVDAANAPPGSPAGSTVQALAFAQYSARLAGDSLIDGEAVFDLKGLPQGPALVPLDPCGLAIGEAVWASEDRQPARLGAGSDGRLLVATEHSGRLQCKWSLRGRRDPLGSIEIPLELPACPASRLSLDLPKGTIPLVEHGVVVQEATAGSAPTRWRIELGGYHRQKLRLVSAEDLDVTRKPNSVRQVMTYDLSARGLDVSILLLLDVPNAPLRQVTLELDPGLQLTAARYGEAAVRWSVLSGPGEGKKSRVVLELPERLRGFSRGLRLTATAPLELGRRWRLPSLRVEGLFWQEGRATLVIPAQFVLEELAVLEGRQTGTGRLTAPRVGQSAEVQYFAPDGGVEIVLAPPRAPLHLETGTALELNDVEMAARIVAALRVPEGERFQLDAEVSRLWAVDAVETIPADALGSWDFQQNKGGSGKLIVRLAKAVSPSRPIRLLVTARHFHSPLGKTFAAEDLAALRFPGATGGRRLVAIHAPDSFQVKPAAGDGLGRVDPQSLTAAELKLFAEPPTGLIFESGPGASRLQVSVDQKKPRYWAAIRVEAVASDQTLTESYRIGCVPEGGRVDRLLVQSSQAREVPIQWSLSGEGEGHLNVRPWQPSGGSIPPRQSQTWEVALRRPRSAPFEILATRVSPLAKATPVGLVCLPEAGSQRGTLAVASSGSAAIRVQNDRLTPIPTEQVSADPYSATRTTYRYDPLREAAAAGGSPVVVIPGDSRLGPPTAWAWSVNLESRYEADGTGRHLATYRVQNAGRQLLEVQLPPPLTQEKVQGVWIDETRVTWQRGAGDPQRRLGIALPPGRKYASVSVHFLTNGPPLGIFASLDPPVPSIDMPVLARTWTVWLPPGYQATERVLRGQRGTAPPMTFAQRLFGPLGQGAVARPFRPWAAEDWVRLAARHPEGASASAKARQLVERLGMAEVSLRRRGPEGGESRPGLSSGRVSWGDLLLQWAEDSQWKLLVDRQALDRLALTARSRVPAPVPELPAARGTALLEQADLAMLFSGDAVLLTSVTDAALHRDWLLSTEEEIAWYVLPGPLAGHLRQAGLAGDDPWYLTVDAWARMLPESRALWPVVDLAGHGPADTLGWSAYHIELAGENEARLSVVHRETLRTLGWAAFLAVFALAVWRGLRWPGWLTLLAGLAATLAMVVPEVCVPIASGAFLGILSAFLFHSLGRPRQTPSTAPDGKPCSEPRPPTTVSLRLGIFLLAGVGLGAFQSAVCGGEPAAQPAAESGAVHNVFIPVDAREKPVGDKYYVPEDLFGQLQRLAAARSDLPKGWLIHGANYRGTMSWQSSPEQLVWEELKATLDLEVLARRVRVRIPLGGEGVRLSPQGALLEGRPIRPESSEGDGEISFDVSDPGQYRLELTLLPARKIDGRSSAFEMKIPRLAASRLELAVPADAPHIEIPFACGAVVREGTPGRVTAELGPADRLAVRWQEGAARSSGAAPMDVEQLLWLKVQPGSVVLDAVLKFKAIDGGVRPIQLTADPRLRLLPSPKDRGAAPRVGAVPGQAQTLRFELPHPGPDPWVVEASFLLAEHPGVGALRVPYLDVCDARTTKRWLAVSVDPRLEHQQQVGAGLQPLAVPTFMTAWGDATGQPVAAYQLASSRPRWSMTTKPVPARTTAEQTVWLDCEEAGIQVLLEAALETTGGSKFQYSVSAPPELQVRQVSILEKGSQRVARWSRGPDATITVFLNGPASGKQALSLRGWLPAPPQNSFPPGAFGVKAEELRSSTIHLYRQPAVRVEVSKVPQVTELPCPADDDPSAPQARWVKSFQLQGRVPTEAAVTVSPNRPTIRAEQVTALRCEAGAWRGEVSFRLQVRDGLADEFRVDVPNSWLGPFDVDPPASLKVIDLADQARRTLVIRPAAALEGDSRLKVSSPLGFSPAERIGAREVKLQQADISVSMVVLPAQTDLGPLAWETRGLAPTALPKEYASSPAGAGSLAAYRVVQEPFEALLKSAERARGTPQVLLSDVSVAWQADGTCHGVAVFDVEPAGVSACTLRLPPEHQLIQVTAAGLPAFCTGIDDRTWRVALGSSTLPQRIEILFAAGEKDPPAPGPKEIQAPAVLDLPVRQTLWSVSGPGRLEAELGTGIPMTSRVDQELARLRTITEMMERAVNSSVYGREEMTPWYRVWARRWSLSQDRARRCLVRGQEAEDAATARDELEAIQRRQALIAERLGLGEVLAQVAVETPLADDPIDVWRWDMDRSQSVIRCVTDQPPQAITLIFRQSSGDWPWWQAVGAAGLALGTMVLLLGVRSGALLRLVRRYPYVLGAAAGLAWWLMLTPSVLGWVIAAASLVAWRARPPIGKPSAFC